MRLLDKDPFISENAFPLLEDDVSKLSTMSLKGHAASILDSVSAVNDPLTKLSLLGQYTEMQKELSKRGEAIEIPAFLSKDYMVPTLPMDQAITTDDLKKASLDSDQAFFDSFSSALENEDTVGNKAPTDPLSQMFFQAPNLMDFDTNAFINETLEPGSIPMSDEEIAELEDSGFKESLWDPSEELRRHAALHQDEEFFTLEMEEAYINHLIQEESADLIRVPNALLPEKAIKDKVDKSESESEFENIKTWLQDETQPLPTETVEALPEATVEPSEGSKVNDEIVHDDTDKVEYASSEEASESIKDEFTEEAAVDTAEEQEAVETNNPQDELTEETIVDTTEEQEVVEPNNPQDELTEEAAVDTAEEQEVVEPNNPQDELTEEAAVDTAEEQEVVEPNNPQDELTEETIVDTTEEQEVVELNNPQDELTEETIVDTTEEQEVVETNDPKVELDTQTPKNISPESSYDPGQSRVDELKNKLLEIQEKKRKRAAELAKRKRDLM